MIATVSDLDSRPSTANTKIIVFIVKALIFLKICSIAWPTQTPPSPLPTTKTHEAPDPEFLQLTTFRPSNLTYHNLADKQLPEDMYFWLSTPKPAQDHLLCKLHLDNRCRTVDPAEVIDLMLALHILYTPFQDYMPLLYNYTLWFRDYLEVHGITTVIMESIRTDVPQTYVATDPNRRKPREIQITNDQNFYKRENLLNVALELVKDIEYEYILWIDAHQQFLNPYWWLETIVKCEKFPSVQLFANVGYIGGVNTSIAYSTPSFNYVSLWNGGIQENMTVVYGNAWAVRREVYVAVERILDTCVVAFCDGYWGLAGMTVDLHDYILGQYDVSDDLHRVEDWILKARDVFKGKRTVIRGKLLHFYHERVLKYRMVMKALNEHNGRYNLSTGIQREKDGTLVTVDRDLDAFWKILTTYTHYKEPIG